MAGYSHRSLKDKLGIKDGYEMTILNAPSGYESLLGDLSRVIVSRTLTQGQDVIHFFCRSETDLDSRFPSLRDSIVRNGLVWISWPKKTSALASALDENTVREIGLKHGMVDVKVCAVDQDWSGLKFVIRVKDRNM